MLATIKGKVHGNDKQGDIIMEEFIIGFSIVVILLYVIDVLSNIVQISIERPNKQEDL